MTDDPRADADGEEPGAARRDGAVGTADGDETAEGDETGEAVEPGGQWRFALDEVGPEAEAEREAARNPPIEPEPVDVENALFVVAGVLGTLLLLFSVTL
ncbi:hypothetical protein BRC97_04480 [Halobacteriales archaeon QS_6_71_20]|nr:MAG: hypothetical protein BRC97_04480 [Halobacteriales archaeon QS_6_71_20]